MASDWDRRGQVGGVELFWREAPSREGHPPVLYVHGNPTNCDDFLDFLERTGGLAPDLPGFGRSDKPAHFPYTIDGYSDLLASFLAARGVDRFSLVVHDWGGAALGLAQRAPERVVKLVLIDALPLLPGYRWHRLARIWRTPLLGELSMGLSTRWALKLVSRGATAGLGPAPDFLIDRVWAHFDHGTQRAILKLHRSAPPGVLARAGARLGELRCPALIVWGADDRCLPPSLAQAYANALGGSTRVDVREGMRHWPWIDDPSVVEDVTAFLSS